MQLLFHLVAFKLSIYIEMNLNCIQDRVVLTRFLSSRQPKKQNGIWADE